MEQGDFNNFLISFSDENIGSFLWEMPESIKELEKRVTTGYEEEWQRLWSYTRMDIQNLIKGYLCLLCGMLSFPPAIQELREILFKNLQKISEESLDILNRDNKKI